MLLEQDSPSVAARLLLPAGARHLDGIGDDLDQIDRSPHPLRVDAGELLNAQYGVSTVAGGLFDDVDISLELRVDAAAAPHQLRAPEDRPEEVVEVVSDPAGQLTQRAQPLGTLQPLPQPDRLGHVDEQALRRRRTAVLDRTAAQLQLQPCAVAPTRRHRGRLRVAPRFPCRELSGDRLGGAGIEDLLEAES